MLILSFTDVLTTVKSFSANVSADNRKPGIHIAWTTVSYRSVALLIIAAAAIFFGFMWVTFPQFTQSSVKKADDVMGKLLERIAGMAPKATGAGVVTAQQAHFTALDGTVRVKKGNGNTWVAADYNIPLEKGDVVQTGSEGMAKVVFNDGTSYTVKQDSLIVVEENSANDQQQTNVAVAVSTGTVDLSTATYSSGSKSQVIVAGATASLAPESAAQVHNDPNTDQHEILMKKGTGEVTRNGETVELANWEKVSFHGSSPHLEKAKETGPPTPIAPANMAPLFSGEATKDVEFTWTAMANATGYRLRISRNPYFSSTLVDKKVTTAAVTVSGLGEGAYYWMVQSYDASGKESVESEKNRFTIIAKGKETEAIQLDLDPFIQHGHVIEVTGKTQNGARVMVNGSEVPMVASDGSFHYFTPPLPTGEAVITVTAQTAQGGVNTQQKKIIIQ
jgi:hypothetical protein